MSFIPLKQFIDNFLANYYIKNTYTNNIERGLDIFNWKKSGALGILINQNYYIETRYNFATTDTEYGLVEVADIPVKKIVKYEDYEPYYKNVVKTEKRPYKRKYIEPIFKYVKIGRTTYYTTQYKTTYKTFYRSYKTKIKELDYRYVIKEKEVITYKKSYKKISYKYYEPFLLYEDYKTDGDEIVHELFIAPYYSKYGEGILIADYDENIGEPIFALPEDIPQTRDYKKFIELAKKTLFNNTSQKKVQEYFDNYIHRKNKKNYKSSYHHSLDILDIVFYINSNVVIDDEINRKVENLTKQQFNEEIL